MEEVEYIIYFSLMVSSLLLYMNLSENRRNIWVILFIASSIILDIYGYTYPESSSFHVYNYFEYILVTLALGLEIKSERVVKIMRWSLLIVPLLYSLSILNYNSKTAGNAYFCISAVFLIPYILWYLREKYEPPYQTSSLLEQPFFWFCGGFLLYFSSSIMSWVIPNAIEITDKFLKSFIYYNRVVMGFLLYILIIIGTQWKAISK